MESAAPLGAIGRQRSGEGMVPGGVNLPLVAADDLELASRVRQGDADALATLYDRYASAVHGLARAILRDDRLAEEATHDVFLGIWQQPRAFEAARGTFAGWLLRVTRNRAIDLARRRREQPFTVVRTADGEPAADIASWVVDPDPDPADQATSLLLRQDVRAALSQLTPDHRRLLELAYFGGLTQREIADRLGRPLGTVKTQIRTAMRRLAGLMEGIDPSVVPSTTAADAQPPYRPAPGPQ